MPLISVITCTYNPDVRLLSRVLEAIKNLRQPEGHDIEYILVDNNSSPALEHIDSYRNWFATNGSWARIVLEKKPGLSAARLCGLAASKGDLIVFFDDDNEPDPDYLEQTIKLRTAYPEVGVWGPGNVTVEFIGKPEEWVQKYALEKLQELHLEEITYSKDIVNFDKIPYGTGLVMERRIMDTYKHLYTTSENVTQGRTAKSLISSEDIQMVYMATRHNLAAGRAPSLKVKHLINESKSNYEYIKMLYYGCSIGGFPVLAQSFPNRKLEQANPVYDTLHFALYNTYYFMKMALFQRNFRKWECQTTGMIASTESRYNYYKKPIPAYLRLVKKLLKL